MSKVKVKANEAKRKFIRSLTGCKTYLVFSVRLPARNPFSRDVGLETWSWSRDRSRPLFEVLVLVLVSTLLVLFLVLVLASLVLVSVLVLACLVLVLVLVSEGGLEQDLRLYATATLLVSKVETSK